MLTKHISTLLLAILIAAILSQHIELWMLHSTALILGISTAFSIPSGSSMLFATVVAPEHLQSANGMMLGLRQITFFLGALDGGWLDCFV